MDSTFADMIAKGWLVIYMDNILVMVDTEEQFQEQTKCVLQCMQEEDLHLKLAKCAFDQLLVEYLGLIIKTREVHMDPTKLAAACDWGPPTCVKAV